MKNEVFNKWFEKTRDFRVISRNVRLATIKAHIMLLDRSG